MNICVSMRERRLEKMKEGRVKNLKLATGWIGWGSDKSLRLKKDFVELTAGL